MLKIEIPIEIDIKELLKNQKYLSNDYVITYVKNKIKDENLNDAKFIYKGESGNKGFLSQILNEINFKDN